MTGLLPMLIAAARELEDGQTVFTGFHWPILVTDIARRLHAPNLVRIFEAGVVQRRAPAQIMTSTTEMNRFLGTADYVADTLYGLYTALRRGHATLALLGASTVDRFGNINTTVVGPYESPKVRLAGSGGATEVAAFAQRTVIINGTADPRRYVDDVGFVTSPGFLRGGRQREEAGYPEGSGPVAIYTPWGVLRFHPGTRSAYLDERFPGVDPAPFLEATGWPVRTGGAGTLTPPTREEARAAVTVVREARARGYRLPEVTE